MVHVLKIKYLYVALNIKQTVVNRKDVDVNERERLSNFTNIFIPQLYTYKQIKVKEQHFYCCFEFQSLSKVFNNEHASYPKMSVKQSLVSFEWYSLILLIIATSGLQYNKSFLNLPIMNLPVKMCENCIYRDVQKVFSHCNFLLYISYRTTFFKNIIPKSTLVRFWWFFYQQKREHM